MTTDFSVALVGFLRFQLMQIARNKLRSKNKQIIISTAHKPTSINHFQTTELLIYNYYNHNPTTTNYYNKWATITPTWNMNDDHCDYNFRQKCWIEKWKNGNYYSISKTYFCFYFYKYCYFSKLLLKLAINTTSN